MRGLWHSGSGAVLEEKKSKSIIHPFVIKSYNGLTLNSMQRAGELIPIVSGNKQAFEKVRQVIEKLGRIFYVGEKDGSANTIKLALNLNIALIASGLSEGITLVRRADIDPSIFIEILNSTYFKTGLSEKKGPKMVKSDFSPTFHLARQFTEIYYNQKFFVDDKKDY